MNGKVVIGTELNTSTIDKQIVLLEDKLEGLIEEYEILERAEPFEGQNKELIKLGNEIDTTRKKLAKLNQQPTIDFSDMGKGIQKATKRIAKMALAVFGIRSAFMFVRSSINTIAAGDEQLKADIDYMKNALAYAIEPIVRGIVNLAKQLLFYIGYIAKSWFGINIFENANKSLKDSNKQAKELKKTMAGFDEMNVVGGETKSQGTATPSFDLSNIEDVDAPKWIKWIAQNGPKVVSIIAGISGGLIALKLGIRGIRAFAIGVTIEGILYTLGAILEYINNPSWSNFGNILVGIGIIVAGLAVAFTSLPLAIAAAILAILGTIASFWDKIKDFFSNIINGIYELGDNIKKFLIERFSDGAVLINVFIDTIVGVFTGAVRLIFDLFNGLFTGIKNILDGIILICKGNFKQGIETIFKGIANFLIGILNGLIDAVNIIVSPLRAIIVGLSWVMGKNWSMENIKIPNIPYLAKGGIVNNPGPGVLMGSYVAGERGPEAVIPLDDDTLDRLGLSFAKHTVINATIINEMNGRIISRELKKINAEDNFAYNG